MDTLLQKGSPETTYFTALEIFRDVSFAGFGATIFGLSFIQEEETMGLFDMFKGDAAQAMTPKLAFISALIYMMASDGQVEEEEIGQLMVAAGGDRANFDAALKYVRKNNIDTFLQQAAPVLSEPQKLCILTNLCDSLLADGDAAPAEQALFNRFLGAFGITEETFRPYFQVIALKNDRSVFAK